MKNDEDPIYQDLRAFSVPPGFRGRSAVVVQLWWIIQATLFSLSPQVCFGWRVFLLRLFGARIGHGVRIRASARITYPWKLVVGDYVWIGDETTIYNLGDVTIGSHVALAHNVFICTGFHRTDVRTFDIGEMPVVVENEVWVASDVFVAPGVTLKRGCVVGARSTVLEDMPCGAVCVGTPCKPIKQRGSSIDGSTEKHHG